MASIGPFLASVSSFVTNTVERVELPKTVVIRNFRLGVLLKCMQVLALGFFCLLLADPAARYKNWHPHEMGLQNGWYDTPVDEYVEAARKDVGRPFCTDPSPYDYVYSSRWEYTNYTCVTIPKVERLFKEGGVLFAPLSFEEEHAVYEPAPGSNATRCPELLAPCAAGWIPESHSMCRCPSVSNHFVAGAGSLKFSLLHKYSIEVPPTQFSFTRRSSQTSDAECGALCEEDEEDEEERDRRLQQLRTVVVVTAPDGTKTVLADVIAPDALTLGLQDVLEASGMSLGDTRTVTFPNLLRCGVPGSSAEGCRQDVAEHPLMRQTGVLITAHFHYANRRMYKRLRLDELDGLADVSGHQGPICKVDVSVAPAWEGWPKVDCSEPVRAAGDGAGVCRARYYYGVKVKVIAAGDFGYLDFAYFAVSAGASAVYLTLPVMVVGWLAIYFLGVVSNIYVAAEKQQLSISEQLAGFAARTLTAQQAFLSIAGSEEATISKELLLTGIMTAFRTSDLDKAEQVRLAELVMELMDKDNSGGIGLEEFVRAFGKTEAVSVDNTVHLFDQDRKMSFLERFFRPHSQISGSRRVFERTATGNLDMEEIEKNVSELPTQTSAHVLARAPPPSSSPRHAPASLLQLLENAAVERQTFQCLPPFAFSRGDASQERSRETRGA